ncbi:MAG TPA: hypothetical protein VIT21_00605 [Chthoniobacterales bacterium]
MGGRAACFGPRHFVIETPKVIASELQTTRTARTDTLGTEALAFDLIRTGLSASITGCILIESNLAVHSKRLTFCSTNRLPVLGWTQTANRARKVQNRVAIPDSQILPVSGWKKNSGRS